MATHTAYKKFAVKYNREFKIAGVHKMKKADLIDAIEERLKKSRKEIRDEYKQLKNMVKKEKPIIKKEKPIIKKKKPIIKKKISKKDDEMINMFAFMVGDTKKDVLYTKAQLKKGFNNVDKLLSGVQASEWKRVYNETQIKKTPAPAPKKTPVKKQTKKQKDTHNLLLNSLKEMNVDKKEIEHLSNPFINIISIFQDKQKLKVEYKFKDSIQIRTINLPKFKIDKSKQPKMTPSKIVMSKKPSLNTKKIKKPAPIDQIGYDASKNYYKKIEEETKKKNDKDINYKKVFKVFDEYYKLVNVELKKYLKGQISSDELDEKQYIELQDEYDYRKLAVSLGLYKDISGSRVIDPNIQKQLNKDSKNYQEFLELIKKPAPIDPIEYDEDIDDWDKEDLRCYLDTYLRYGKPDNDPWSEVKKGLAKEHRTFDKFKKYLLNGYERLLTTDKDMTLKNCGKKKFDEAMKQYKSIGRAKNYKEYFVNYVDLGFGKSLGYKKPNPYRKK
tara:strand:+ start:2509 stop:4005 length:1497 start_codon:yes stop_codon:yes gene_type:complete